MIKEGDYVIFKKTDTMKIFPVKLNKPFMIDRFKTKLDNLVNKPFGYKYEIKDQQLHLVQNTLSDDMNKVAIFDKDNRNLVDKSANQKLSHDEIEKLKQLEDISGTEIIDRLIENSASFSQKTEYSQEKYIKKKKEKYLAVFEILKPTIRTLSEYYILGNHKRKVLNMRMDTLAQILTYSNVAAYRNVVVLESCKGLILASVVERVAGFGNVINLSPNGSHISTKEILDYMNFPPEYTQNLYNFPLERSDKLDEYIEELNKKLAIATDDTFRDKQTKKLELAHKVNEIFKTKKVDCLIIASKFRPSPILEKLIDSMAPNRNFVIYSLIQEPLIECHSFLKRTQKAIHIELSDSWLREYQVLPERTHPKNNMDCCGGYLLTGITVTNE
ncbi:unnamed protein product [Brachionus calyciflorus]|uniref:tRNA (adenine(58)-N(1))-methyltransferase non-catalytic subunit TRM6 n=1 Tax=Brachionus calyciflorus TaxID=104777 RepID=A0A814H8L2_9BILA|nr:unnamed protein product [Brachionus calyciflorus]